MNRYLINSVISSCLIVVGINIYANEIINSEFNLKDAFITAPRVSMGSWWSDSVEESKGVEKDEEVKNKEKNTEIDQDPNGTVDIDISTDEKIDPLTEVKNLEKIRMIINEPTFDGRDSIPYYAYVFSYYG